LITNSRPDSYSTRRCTFLYRNTVFPAIHFRTMPSKRSCNHNNNKKFV
jgi:hypothetical protein